MGHEKKKPTAGVEGEGSRTAARQYNEGAAKSAKTGQGEKKGREAADALEGPEGEKLREAERAGREPARRSARA